MEYTVVEKLGKDLKEGDEYWDSDDAKFCKYHFMDIKGDLLEQTFLVRVPSSPVMSFEEFKSHYCPLLSNREAENRYFYYEQGCKVGTRSIVPEMTDAQILNEARKVCIKDVTEYESGYIDGLKGYRNWLRSQINK